MIRLETLIELKFIKSSFSSSNLSIRDSPPLKVDDFDLLGI